MRNEIWLAISTMTIAINAIPVAASSKDAYLAETDSAVVVRDYIANMEYVNGVLERVNFEGGYIDMTGESPRYMYYVTDHLGNVRTVVDEDGHVCQVNHYYPYGDRIDDSRDISAEGSDNMRLFGGKEYSEDTGLHDFEARYADTRFGRFTTLDPMAEKYYSVSPYAYCAGNPVRFVDPSGMDWYRDSDGRIQWTDLTSQDSMDEQKVSGIYLGSIVVSFEGRMDERLGWDSGRNQLGNIDGQGAVTARVTVYGQKNKDDIAYYTGFTMTSDYAKFGAIADGEYNVTYRESSGTGSIPKHYMVNKGGPVDCINNSNPSPKEYGPYSATQKDGIFIHRTNMNGWAGDIPSKNMCVSSGCLLIRAGDWAEFSKQVGKNGFRLLLERK